MWFNIAAAAGDSVATNNRDALTLKMNAQQISDSQNMARAWQAGRILPG
jgi:hypothetical protein